MGSPNTKPENKVAWMWTVETNTPIEKLVLGAIVQMFNEKNLRAWPSQKRLSIMTGLSERTVGRAIEGLQAQGIVEVEPHIDAESGAQVTNRYYLPTFDPRSTKTQYLPVRVQRYYDTDGTQYIDRYDARGNLLDD
jgi:DNA-binding transcriptional MocR family regulator